MTTPELSSRTAWPAEENALSRALAEARARGECVLDLTHSNPTSAGFHYDADLLADLADPRSLVYEPRAFGHPAARQAVADHHAARGVVVDPSRVVITASTSEAYAYLFQLLADHGDEVLVPTPSYPLFGYLADLAGVRLVPYPLVYDGAWHIDLPALRAAVTARTRAILIVSPNNPTGSFLRREELAELRVVAERHRLALVADEVFADYELARRPSAAPTLAGEETGLAFALSGLSKAAALPQLKLGWMVVAGDAGAVGNALARLELLADTYLSVGTPVQLALARLLERAPHVTDQIRSRITRNLAAIRAALAAGSHATLLDVEGGWYATLRVPATRSEDEWTLSLLARGVLVHPGHFFDFHREAYLVISLLTPPEELDAGLRVLLSLVDDEG